MKKFLFFSIIIFLVFIFVFLLKGENVFFTSLMPFQRLLYGGNEKGDPVPEQARYGAGEIVGQIQDARIKVYKDENEILKKHLKFLDESYDNFVIADVIGAQYELSSQWFLLDKGARDGLKKGFAVLDENGILVGTIAKIESSISYMKPIFDRRSLIAVDVLGNEGEDVSGIVSGEYGLSIKMKYIPIDKNITQGDTVITSGLDENIRRGIIIGSVAVLRKNPNAIFQDAIIEPFFNPNFRIVSILIPEL